MNKVCDECGHELTSDPLICNNEDCRKYQINSSIRPHTKDL